MPLSLNGTSGLSGVDGSAGTPALQGSDTNTGIHFGTDEINLDTGGSTRVTVDSSGNVGIGDTAPSEKLNVAGNVMLEGGDQYLYLTNAGTGNSGIYIRGNTAGTYLRSHTTGIFTWETSGTERMRIASNGDVLIAATDPADNADTGFKFRPASNSIACTIDTSSSSQSHYHLYNLNATNNGYRFYVKANGGISNYSANNQNLSDINVKKDISPAAGTWDCIKEWEIVNYRYKDQPDDANLNLGVIAQQVAESCPEVVTIFQEAKEATDDQPAQEERLGVKEQHMTWMAIKALQEAQTRIEQLETRVAQLEGGAS